MIFKRDYRPKLLSIKVKAINMKILLTPWSKHEYFILCFFCSVYPITQVKLTIIGKLNQINGFTKLIHFILLKLSSYKKK